MDVELPDDTLINLTCHHQGVVTQTLLSEAGFDRVQVQQWCKQHILSQIDQERYQLHEDVISIYVDGIVQMQWAVPEGIFGRTTALIYHHLTVAQPYIWDICVPAEWSGALPSGVNIQLFTLPPSLHHYGVTTIYPRLPGGVPVAIYSPAVAVMQVLLDENADPRVQKECVWMYRGFRGDEEALQEAAARYQVSLPPRYQARQHGPGH